MSAKVHPTYDHPHMEDGTFDLVLKIRWGLGDFIIFEDGRGRDLPCPDFAKEVVAKLDDPKFDVEHHMDEIVKLVTMNGYTHDEKDIAASSEFLSNQLEEWDKTNPCPTIPYPELPKIKKWPAGTGEKQITPEMRQEREETKKRILEIQEQYAKDSDAATEPWFENQNKVKEGFLREYFASHPDAEVNPKVKARILKWSENPNWSLWCMDYIAADKLEYTIKPIDLLDPTGE
jgi:hypothetical protein